MLARRPSRQKIPIAIQKPSVTFPHRNTEDLLPESHTPVPNERSFATWYASCMHRRENYQSPSLAQTQYNPAEVKRQHKEKETTTQADVDSSITRGQCYSHTSHTGRYLISPTSCSWGSRHLLFSSLLFSHSIIFITSAACVSHFLSIPPIIFSSVSAYSSISGFAVVSHESRTILQSSWLNSPCFDYYPSVA